MGFKKYKNDILLILAVVLLAGGAWCVQLASRQQGLEAVVTIDGEETARLPLDEDTEFVIEGDMFAFYGKDRSFTNTVVVKDGRVCVTQANCPDEICRRQGWIEYSGESIVCLPHRLAVTVSGKNAVLDAAAR